MTTIQTAVPGAKLRTEFKTREQLEIFLHPGIAPVVVVSDLSGPFVADRGYPRSAMGIVSTPAGGAGTNAQCVCVGVGGIGKIYSVEQVVVIKGAAAGRVQVRFSNGAAIAGLTDVTSKGFTDQRISETAPDMQIARSSPITASIDGAAVGSFVFIGLEAVTIPLGVVLGFGGFVSVVNITTNEALDATFFWTEYLLEDR